MKLSYSEKSSIQIPKLTTLSYRPIWINCLNCLRLGSCNLHQPNVYSYTLGATTLHLATIYLDDHFRTPQIKKISALLSLVIWIGLLILIKLFAALHSVHPNTSLPFSSHLQKFCSTSLRIHNASLVTFQDRHTAHWESTTSCNKAPSKSCTCLAHLITVNSIFHFVWLTSGTNFLQM